MRCPHCYSEVPDGATCARCGQPLHHDVNDAFYAQAEKERIGLKDLFSQAFRRRARGAAFQALTRQPVSPAEALERWRKPWLFVRLFGILFLPTALNVVAWDYRVATTSTAYVYAYFWACCVVPFTLMLFLWELDMFTGFSVFETFGLALAGGVSCLVVSLPIQNALAAAGCGMALRTFADHVILLLMAMALMSFGRKRMYGLSGMVMGAAIGAGFTVLQLFRDAVLQSSSASYAFAPGVESFFGNHSLWLAASLGALCLRTKGERLKPLDLLDVRFLGLFILGIAENLLQSADNTALGSSFAFLNQSLFTLPILKVDVVLKEPILLVIGWTALILTIRPCLRQALRVGNWKRAPEKKEAIVTGRLLGLEGTCAGRVVSIPADRPLRIGREQGAGVLTLTSSSVSRTHCELFIQNGRMIVRDLGSSNGTWLNGKRLESNRDASVKPGDRLEIGSKKERFEVQ